MSSPRIVRRLFRWIGRSLLAVLILLAAVAAFGWFRPLAGESMTPSGLHRTVSQYVTMHDGTKIAVDLRLPADLATGQHLPTAFRATRYFRGVEFGPLGRIGKGLGIFFPPPGDTEAMNTNGFVVLTAEVRGTGASFGQRSVELSSREIDDLVEVLDWVVAQRWSDGRVCLFGTSYDGNVVDLLAARAHPAVKAAAPAFSPWDEYVQPIRPGGLLNLALLKTWSQLAMSSDRGDRTPGLKGWLESLFIRVPKPVDDDRDRQLLKEAVASHATADVLKLAQSFEFRDDTTKDGLDLKMLSPAEHAEGLNRSGIPLLVRSSWMDSSYGAGALQRFVALSNPQTLIMGVWNHGGGLDADPFAPADKPANPSHLEQWAQLINFMKLHLSGNGSAAGTGEVRYFTLGEGTWKTTMHWPPQGFAARQWYFQAEGRMERTPPAAENASDEYAVDFEVNSASTTRWHQLVPVEMTYTNRAKIDRHLLTYTSSPLERAIEVTGTPVVCLHVASTAKDCAFHAYLEDIAPDGRVTYITEGMLRAVHRKPLSRKGAVASAQHSFLRADASPMVPNEVAVIEFELLPTSVVFDKEHRIRLALAGADAGNFERVPAEGSVDWKVHRDAIRPSHLELPVRDRNLAANVGPANQPE